MLLMPGSPLLSMGLSSERSDRGISLTLRGTVPKISISTLLPSNLVFFLLLLFWPHHAACEILVP